jgi:hypothetical protein
VIDLAREVRVRDHPAQRALEFAHVGPDPLGHEEGHFARQFDAGLLGLALQDRDARLEFRRFDRDRQAPAEARAQPFLEPFHLLRIAVGGQDDLLLTFQQRVEGMEEFFLGALLAGEELDVVDQQRIGGTVVLLEFVDRVVLQRLDHVRNEALGVQVDDPAVGNARSRMRCPIACIRWVLPRPTEP